MQSLATLLSASGHDWFFHTKSSNESINETVIVCLLDAAHNSYRGECYDNNTVSLNVIQVEANSAGSINVDMSKMTTNLHSILSHLMRLPPAPGLQRLAIRI